VHVHKFLCILSVHYLYLVGGFAPSEEDIDEFIGIITQLENGISLVKAPTFVEGWKMLGARKVVGRHCLA